MMHKDCDIRNDPNCWGPNLTNYTGIELIYAAGHCHAPSCISMELYHADTALEDYYVVIIQFSGRVMRQICNENSSKIAGSAD